MIIVQTPLRVSLFGGGTDFPGFYLKHGGCVFTSAIDKVIFLTIKSRFDHKIRVGYTHTEMTESLEDVQHELIRESLRLTGIKDGVEITTMGDIPSQGSGLGSSSTVTVGALHAMHRYQGELVTAKQLAEQACRIERDILGKPIGIQDQYIAAYGGLRFMEFKVGGEIVSRRIHLSERCMRNLNQNLMLFFTGVTRKADKILSEQKQNIRDRESVLCEMRDIAYDVCAEVEKENIDVIGEMLDKSWQLKKQLATQVSNPVLDEMYETAVRAGAIGGKISGAGGGGFLLLYCRRDKQEAVRDALTHLQELPFRLNEDGSKVIFDYNR